MDINEGYTLLNRIISARISAQAKIKGNDKYEKIYGEVNFFSFNNGCIVMCILHNLPKTKTNIFGFHIHQNGECKDDFSSAGPHYGTGDHPNHYGDLPVLISNDGDAFMAFYTNRFTVNDVVDRAVIVHLNPDDYTTQPAGNSGVRIACGVIKKKRNKKTL